MVPIQLSEKQEIRLKEYLWEQLDAAEQDRKTFVDQLTTYHDLYEGKTRPKNFPWPGASNLTIPLIPITVDTIMPRVIGTMLATQPYMYVRARMNEMSEFAENLQDFEQYYFDEILDLYAQFVNASFDYVLNGMTIVKNVWEHSYKPRVVYDRKGKMQQTLVETYRGPKWHVCSLEDIVVPYNASSLQDAHFVAHNVDRRFNDVLTGERTGKYKKGFAESLRNHLKRDVSEEVERAVKESQGLRTTQPWLFDLLRLSEVWINYDLANDGREVPIVVTFHKDAKAIGRVIHHPYFHGLRPFACARYITRPRQFFGLGVAQMLRDLALELSTIHNQTIDSATIANVKCFKARKGSGISPNEKVYPGKIFFMDNLEDFQEFMLGEVKASSFKISEETQLLAEKRSGVSDYTLGRESGVLKSRATARGTLALISEGNRRFDLSIREFRAMFDELTKQNVELHQQFEPGGREWINNSQVFKTPFPQFDVRRRLVFKCAASDAAINKQVEQETNMMLLERSGVVYDTMIKYMMLAANPQAPIPVKLMAMRSAKAYYALAKRAMKSLNVANVEDYLPEMKEADFAQLIAGGVGGGPGTSPVGGMGGPPQMAPGAGGPFGQVGPQRQITGGVPGQQRQVPNAGQTGRTAAGPTAR